MRLFQALANLWRGFVSLFIEDIAKANPEAAYAGVIQDMTGRRQKLLDAASKVVALRNQKQGEFDRVSRELAQVERDLKGAITRNLRDAGKLLVRKKDQLVRQKTQLEAELVKANGMSEDVKRDLKKFDGEIRALRDEARVNVARLRSAQAMNRVQDMISGLSVDGSMQMLEGLRGSIEAEIAKVDVQREIASTNLDEQLDVAREAGEAAAGEAEFDALRAQFEAQQGTATVATPAGAGDDATGGGKQV